MVYTASTEDFWTCYENWTEYEHWEGAFPAWADEQLPWPGVKLRRVWHYAGGVTDRLARKRYLRVSLMT
jgi:hypothetical protein